jgi:hypothetical protein
VDQYIVDAFKGFRVQDAFGAVDRRAFPVGADAAVAGASVIEERTSGLLHPPDNL